MNPTAKIESTASSDVKFGGEKTNLPRNSRLSLAQIERAGEIRRAMLIAKGLSSDLKNLHRILVEQGMVVPARGAWIAKQNVDLIADATERELASIVAGEK